MTLLILISASVLSGCANKNLPTLRLQPVKYSELPNWNNDRLTEAWPAFMRSCHKLYTVPKNTVFLNHTSIREWRHACALGLSLHHPSEATIKHFFEKNFKPFKVWVGKNDEGLFTGYYEPELNGSRYKSEQYAVPLYKRPPDLIMVEDLGIFNPDLKGKRIAGRLVQGRLKPYYTHAEIDQGALSGYELVWIEDPLDAFFIQIQGSAAIRLENGELIHLVYSGTNGHPYTAIGSVLIAQNVLTTKNVSMQAIRDWLKQHPEQAKAVLYHNASFVFFTMHHQGPLGNQGTVLIPGRSMAVDPVYIAYGTPLWLDIEHPMSSQRIQRLVIAQDKGGAIKGPIRGDFFWGTGQEAGELAGRMKSRGGYYVLLPN